MASQIVCSRGNERTIEEEIDAVLKEELLQPSALAWDSVTHGGCRAVAIAVAGAVDTAVAVHDDPRLLVTIAVGFGQVSLQERKLLRACVGGANPEVELGGDRDVVHEPRVPGVPPVVPGEAVGGGDGATVRWHVAERLGVVRQRARAVLVVADGRHVGNVRGDLLDVPHEDVAVHPVVSVHVVREVPEVQDHIGRTLRHHSQRLVLALARSGRAAVGAQGVCVGCPHVPVHDVELRLPRGWLLVSRGLEVEDFRPYGALVVTHLVVVALALGQASHVRHVR